MKILYLYSEVMGYTMATLRALVKLGVEIHLVHWDHKKITPYRFDTIPNLTEYKRSEMNREDLLRLAQKLSPDITVISGWMDKDYLFVSRRLRTEGRITVAAFDAQWNGSLKQIGLVGLSQLGYLRKYFSHAWVPGCQQYLFARKLGFKNQEIIFDLYSGDVELFHAAHHRRALKTPQNYPKRFLFVGRLEPVKGVHILLNAWRSLETRRDDWELHLIGSGTLTDTLRNTPGIVVKDFMQPADLVKEAAEAGCFILPSLVEPWGVVAHEFSAAGLPLILSDKVGARSTYLIAGLNGFSYNADNPDELATSLLAIISLSQDRIIKMGQASQELAGRITPRTSASNLLSIFISPGNKI